MLCGMQARGHVQRAAARTHLPSALTKTLATMSWTCVPCSTRQACMKQSRDAERPNSRPTTQVANVVRPLLLLLLPLVAVPVTAQGIQDTGRLMMIITHCV